MAPKRGGKKKAPKRGGKKAPKRKAPKREGKKRSMSRGPSTMTSMAPPAKKSGHTMELLIGVVVIAAIGVLIMKGPDNPVKDFVNTSIFGATTTTTTKASSGGFDGMILLYVFLGGIAFYGLYYVLNTPRRRANRLRDEVGRLAQESEARYIKKYGDGPMTYEEHQASEKKAADASV